MKGKDVRLIEFIRNLSIVVESTNFVANMYIKILILQKMFYSLSFYTSSISKTKGYGILMNEGKTFDKLTFLQRLLWCIIKGRTTVKKLNAN
jgi:hypothetical protein